MFAVIYRFYIKPEFESEFPKQWKKIATYFVKERGSFGSTLNKSEDGMWIAYSKWPDKATRDASWSAENEAANSLIPLDLREVIEWMKNSMDMEQKMPEICMEVYETITKPLAFSS
jgi:hypothetical protein